MIYTGAISESHIENSHTYCIDNMEAMRQTPDKYYSLAVVDPEYGIGEDGLKNHSRGKRAKATLYKPKSWDKESVRKDTLDQIIRVSKNQIIWGANHFISKLPYDSSAWIVWNKLNGDNDFADCEFAWTSFSSVVRLFTFKWAGMLQGDMKNKEIRIHVTQKPVKLYEWIFKNYSKPGDTIIDTNLGSASSRIAAYRAGLDFTGFEIDRDYFDASEKRFKIFIAQGVLF